MSYTEALARLRRLKGAAPRTDETDGSRRATASVGFGSPARGPCANPGGSGASAAGAFRTPGVESSERVARHEEPGVGVSAKIPECAGAGTDKTDESGVDATSVGFVSALRGPSTKPRAGDLSDAPAPGASAAGTAGVVGGAGWGPEDWRAFLEERAATAEAASRVDRATAGRWAYEACVTRWLNANPPPDDPTRCAYSGDQLPADGGDAVPVLRGGGGHVWVRLCHLAAWRARRRAEAVAALEALGVRAP